MVQTDPSPILAESLSSSLPPRWAVDSIGGQKAGGGDHAVLLIP
jgi:hypothetical protein